MSTREQTYNYTVVRQFAVMTIVWGIVGMAVGVFIAAQLAWPALNFDLPWLSFGRLRPLHTDAVIFAFGGSALFSTSYYVVQRTCHVRLFCDRLAAFTFWGWQLVIVLAAVTLPLGITTSKEYAELEWPIDVLIALVWVAYAIVFLGTIARRRVAHIYVANWFFAAFILAVAMLHIVNSAALPVALWKSYSAYAGVQDAMVQWWYGHNAVGFFLTAGFLGIMYYFIPKQAGRPVYSYRLSVVHFWALIFTYIWAGPHHLHYTALPDWAQSLGMVMSLILLAPSWGGMINGIMTLSGAWEKLRTDPVPPHAEIQWRRRRPRAGRDYRARVGRGPEGAQQPAASLVAQPVRHHVGVWCRLPVSLSRARLEPDGARLDSGRTVRGGDATSRRRAWALVRAVPGYPARRACRGSRRAPDR